MTDAPFGWHDYQRGANEIRQSTLQALLRDLQGHRETAEDYHFSEDYCNALDLAIGTVHRHMRY